MADAVGQAGEHLKWLEELAREPAAFDFYAALRRIESFSATARLGEALRPSEEPVRNRPGPVAQLRDERRDRVRAGPGGVAGAPRRELFRTVGAERPAPDALDRVRAGLRKAGRRPNTQKLHRCLSPPVASSILSGLGSNAADRRARSATPRPVRSIPWVALWSGLCGDTRPRRFPGSCQALLRGPIGSLTRNAEGLRGVVADYLASPRKSKSSWAPGCHCLKTADGIWA